MATQFSRYEVVEVADGEALFLTLDDGRRVVVVGVPSSVRHPGAHRDPPGQSVRIGEGADGPVTTAKGLGPGPGAPPSAVAGLPDLDADSRSVTLPITQPGGHVATVFLESFGSALTGLGDPRGLGDLTGGAPVTMRFEPGPRGRLPGIRVVSDAVLRATLSSEPQEFDVPVGDITGIIDDR